MAPVVQSVILRRNLFSPQEAIDWIVSHGYKATKMDVTPEYYRFRQTSPEHLKMLGYYARTTPLGKDGYLIIYYP